MQLEAQPATDALSGVRGYYLELAPTPTGPFQAFPDVLLQLPLETFIGEGTWYGWLRAEDNAGNSNRQELASYTVPITVTAVMTVPTPEAPAFERGMVNGYGDTLLWDGGWMADAGITHVVA